MIAIENNNKGLKMKTKFLDKSIDSVVNIISATLAVIWIAIMFLMAFTTINGVALIILGFISWFCLVFYSVKFIEAKYKSLA